MCRKKQPPQRASKHRSRSERLKKTRLQMPAGPWRDRYRIIVYRR